MRQKRNNIVKDLNAKNGMGMLGKKNLKDF